MEDTRGKKLKLNTISSFILYLVTIICGFILPRYILNNYGSEINGLVSSITQFLSIISFLELGVGAVVQSALYKPLANNDSILVSQIVRSATRFYRKIAIILVFYIVALTVFYPIIVSQQFTFLYTGTLIVSMGISSFAQYYFGMVDGLLLTSDQRGYIQYNLQTITIVVNTVVGVILIETGSSIQLVKLSTSLIYLIRPIAMRWYVQRNYNIDRNIEYEVEPIKQKWNGIAQHVAAVVLDQTDVIVLTTFSTLSNVSIYNVYHMVVFGVKNLITYMTNGIRAIMGELWARNEVDELKYFFAWTEWIIHTVVVLLFGCTSSLIIPFVRLYTNGINDVDYVVPIFALLITIANAMHCLRLPYNYMILAAGHYKQTQSNYIIAAIINILMSVIAVRYLGLVGVAIGTIAAMVYQTIWMAIYDSNNFLDTSILVFFKHVFVDIISFIIASVLCNTFTISSVTNNVKNWITLAFMVTLVWMIVIIIINTVFYYEFMKKSLFKLIDISHKLIKL